MKRTLFSPLLTTAACLSCLLSIVVAASKARADALIRHPGATHEAQSSVTPMLGVAARYGVEAGVKVDYLLAEKAFVPTLNNSVFLEGSVFAAPGHVFLAPLLRWDFNLHPEWTVYGEAGFEIDSDGGGSVAVLAGAIWRLPQKSFFIRGELDAGHSAARLGPVFTF